MATQLKPQDPPADEPNDPPANDGEGGEQLEQRRDFETEAREHGWVPKDEFKGDPSRWVEAEEFVKRADTMMPLIKADRDRLRRELSELRRSLKQATKHFEGAEKRAYDRAVADIEQRLTEATEAGDVKAAQAALKEMKELKPAGEQPGQPRHSKEEAMAAFDDFRDENEWYDRGGLAGASEVEINARAYADRITERRLRDLKPGEEPPPEEFFASIAADTLAKYPELGQNGVRQPRQKPQSDVSGGGARPGARNTRTYENLPPEAKAQCEKFIRQGVLDAGDVAKSRALYARDFDWDGWNKGAAR